MAERKLTLKQEAWRRVYIKTGNATEAARKAGYKGTPESLSQIGYENLRKLEVPISELLDQMGFDDGALIKKLEEGLRATTTRVATRDGQITDEREYVDYNTRLQYLETLLRLKGKFTQKVEHSGTTQQITTIEIMKERDSDGAEPAGEKWEPIEI